MEPQIIETLRVSIDNNFLLAAKVSGVCLFYIAATCVFIHAKLEEHRESTFDQQQ